jgi:hypothetical protein
VSSAAPPSRTLSEVTSIGEAVVAAVMASR